MKVFCDDASLEKAVNSAVERFNEKLTAGNKLALFQIQSASKVPDSSSLRLLLPIFQYLCLLARESGVKTYRS